MSKQKKCPNCGYISNSDEEFCPNCDAFETVENPMSPDLEREIERKNKRVALEDDLSNDYLNEEEQPQEAEQSKTNIVPEQHETINRFEKPLEEEPTTSNSQNVEKEQPQNVEVPKTTPTPNSNKKKLNSKALIAILAVVAILVGFVGYNKYQDKKEKERIAKIEEQVAKLETDLDALYVGSDRVFLSESFDGDQLALLKEEIAKIDEKKYTKDLNKTVADAEQRAKQKNKVDELFTEAIVKGDKLQDSYLVEPELAIPNDIKSPKDDFEKLINRGYQEARSQKEINDKAKEAMDKVYNGEVKKEASRDLYDKGKEAVEKIKNPDMKKEFEDQLVKVDDSLKKKEEEEKKKAAEAEKKKAVVNNAVSGTKTAGATLPANDGDGEGAYAWAPGIKEKVIGECLRRGYMAEDGYRLIKKEVKNNEGFFELYATSTNSRLLKARKAEELPIYLVTINCKTGWFKGDGPPGS